MRKIELSSEELSIISDALLYLINSTNEAVKKVYDEESLKVLKAATEKYVKLNNKICGM